MTAEHDVKQLLNVFVYFFSPAKWRVVLLVVLTIFYAFIEMVAVAAIFPILQAGLESILPVSASSVDIFNVKSWYVYIGSVLNINYLVTSGIVLIAITIVSFFYRVYYLYFGQKLLAFLWVYHQEGIYSVLSRAEYAFYTREKQGKLIYNTSVASEQIGRTVDSLIRAVSESIKALFLIVLMFFSSWKVTAIILIMGVVYILFSREIIQRMVFHASQERLSLNQHQHQNLNEFITGIKLIKVFDQSLVWMGNYLEMARKNANLLIQIHLGTMLPSLMIQMVIGVSIGAVCIYIGNQPRDLVVGLIPVMGLFVVASSKVNGAISTAITYFSAVASYFPDLQAVFELLHNTPVTNQKDLGVLPFEFKDKISFKNVSFSYSKTEKQILHGVSFSIQKNSTVALVGASGGGKTSILNLLLQLFDSQDGGIFIDGVDLKAINMKSYLRGIGFVSQESFLFNGTVYENISFAREATEEDVKASCEKADAHAFILDLPEGYNTIVGDNGLKLSGGQKQRLGVARALLKNPEILILDEPTSALDSKSEQRIQLTLDKLAKNTTVVVVAHRLSTIKQADKIIVLNDGRIVEEGNHDHLLSLGGFYSRLYGNE